MTNSIPLDLDAIRERVAPYAEAQRIIGHMSPTAYVASQTEDDQLARFILKAPEDISSLLEHVGHLRSALEQIAGMRPEDAGISRMDVAEFARAVLSIDQTADQEPKHV